MAEPTVFNRLADALRLYARYSAVSLRGQMQYKLSFYILSIAQLLATGAEFLGIWILFSRFGGLRGWTLPEVALFYGLVNVSFALADAFARGFDTFSSLIKTGDFDRLLLRPRSTALQVAARELLLNRIGRLLQGACVLGWSILSIPTLRSVPNLILIAAVIAGGTALFYGIIVLQATLTFWTIETLEICNVVTYGSIETGQFPLTIYRPCFRKFFTYVVPLACLNVIPASALLSPGGIEGWAAVSGWLAPVVGFVFLVLSLQVWRLGVRHYTSTGN